VASNPQKELYERIHNSYEAHYYDATALWYRDREVYRHLFSAVSLANADVAEVACGNGHNSLALKRYFPNIRTVGFDISEPACAAYRELVGPAYQMDLTAKMTQTYGPFDAVMVMGGLHHCVADLPQTLENIAVLLKPGGHLLMAEPSSEFFLNVLRRVWYRHDKYFDSDTEHALSHHELLHVAAGRFRPLYLRYFGGPASIIIGNSMILRLPIAAKKWIAPPVMAVESAYNLIPGGWLFTSFMAVWRRN